MILYKTCFLVSTKPPVEDTILNVSIDQHPLGRYYLSDLNVDPQDDDK